MNSASIRHEPGGTRDFGFPRHTEQPLFNSYVAAFTRTHDHATMEMVVSSEGNRFVVVSEAARSPEDDWCDELAYKLCLARAFQALADRAFRQANGRMKSNDDNREHSEKVALARDLQNAYVDVMKSHGWVQKSDSIPSPEEAVKEIIENEGVEILKLRATPRSHL